MPTNLPARALPHSLFGRLARKWRELSDDQTELLSVMSFTLTPLAVFIVLLLLLGPEHMSSVWQCEEVQCIAGP
jgi:hypothetical protein